MKRKMIFFVLTLILLTIFTGGCGGSPSVSTTVNTPSNLTNVTSATSLATVDALDITIREASDYLNDNIPRGNRIVILNIQSSSPDLSDYIIDELIANAVNDRLFSVVDRQQLETIRAEQNFQLSGEVDDNEALAIGRFFGAQTIVSGAVNRLGSGYRIRIRALEVQTAQVQGQFNRNIASSPIINSLIESGTSTSARTTQAVPSTPATRRGGTVWDRNGHSYEVVNLTMNWTDARRYAEERGGYLATITSSAEQAFIENLLARHGTKNVYWIGGYCNSDRIFRWVTGEPFIYTNWAPGEPNGHVIHTNPPPFDTWEDKIQIMRIPAPNNSRSRVGQWNDFNNNVRTIPIAIDGFWSEAGFIIEWD